MLNGLNWLAIVVAGAIATTIVVCIAFNTTVYVAYMSAGERPQLQTFIAIFDLVSYVLTALIVFWMSRSRTAST